MGNVQSTQLNQTMKEFTEYCNHTALTSYTSVKLNCLSRNAVNLTTGGASQCGTDASAFKCVQPPCTIDILQMAATVCDPNGESTSELSSQVSHDIETVMQGFVSQLSDTETAAFQLNFNATKTNIHSFQDLETKISNDIQESTTLICGGQAEAANDAHILLCGAYSGAVTINQNAATQMVASCINSAVLNAVETDTELSTFFQEMDSQQKLKVKGIFSSAWFWIIIAVVVIVIIVVLVLVFKPKKQQQPGGAPVIVVPKSPPTLPTAPPVPTSALVPASTPAQVVMPSPVKVQVKPVVPTSPK